MKTLTVYINETAGRRLIKTTVKDYFKKAFKITNPLYLDDVINTNDPYFSISFAGSETYWSLVDIKNRKNTNELVKSIIDVIRTNWDDAMIIQRTNEQIDGPTGMNDTVCDLLMIGKTQIQFKYVE